MIISPQWALLSGIALSFFIRGKQDIQNKAKSWGTRLLQISVVLLGTSLNFSNVIQDGVQGALITFVSIALVFAAGFIGMKLLKLDSKLGILITMGTAICGGSAIGALAPVIAAESTIMTISLAIVFLLNALAVFIFPPIGNYYSLPQESFGIWSALAIHDTSSVVAASSIYGKEALMIATTVKLTRALWIIPITLIFSLLWKSADKKFTFPWFVLGFLLMSLVFTFFPALGSSKEIILMISKTGFSLTLFLIGLTFDYRKLKKTGVRPLFFGIGLWILVSASSFFFVL